MPPSSCERPVFALIMRPTANTPSMRGTRTSPVSASTRTSANCAPNACIEKFFASGFSPTSPCASSPSAGTTPPYSSCSRARSFAAASQIALPHDEMPIEPPAPGARGSAESPISRRTRSNGTPSASAAICVSAVHVPGADVRRVDRHGVVAVPVDARERLRRPPPRGIGRRGDARADEPAPLRRGRGARSLPSQPKRRAPSRRHAIRPRLLNGCFVSGSIAGSLRMRNSMGSSAARERHLVHRRLQRVHPRALAGRAKDRRRRHVEPREAVRRAAVRRRVHHARRDGGLLGELLDRRRLLDDVVRDRRERAVGSRAEPDALDRRRAVADQREHLLPRELQLHRPPSQLRRHHGDDHVRMGERLGAEAAADVGRDHAHALRLQPERLGDVVADAVRALVAVVQRDAVVAPARERRVRLERVVVIVRRRVGLVERSPRPAANAPSKSPSSVSVSAPALTLSGL